MGLALMWRLGVMGWEHSILLISFGFKLLPVTCVNVVIADLLHATPTRAVHDAPMTHIRLPHQHMAHTTKHEYLTQGHFIKEGYLSHSYIN